MNSELESILDKQVSEVEALSQLRKLEGDNARITEVRQALASFIDELSDLQYLKSKEECDEVLDKFRQGRNLFSQHQFLYRRFTKEIQELKKERANKPSKSSLEYHKLLSEAPICPKCNSVMVHRIGKDKDCWQCESGHLRKKMTTRQLEIAAQYLS